MNAKYLVVILCLIVAHCRTAKSNDPPEEDDPKGKAVVVSSESDDTPEKDRKEKIIVLSSDTDNTPENDPKGKSIVLGSTSARDEKPIVIEELLVEIEIKQKEIDELTKNAEEIEEEIWKMLERKCEHQSEGYILRADLVKVLPEKKDEINKWINENPGDVKDARFILKKPRFKALIDSLTRTPEEQVVLLTPICTLNRQDLSYEDHLETTKEIKKLWKIIELKDDDGTYLGVTTRSHVIKVLPNRVNEIFAWIDNNAKSNPSGSYEITEEEFKELMRELLLDLEELEQLNKNLEENPPVFTD